MNKIAYLTFDDGPSENTVKILEILNLYGIKATFFVVGNKSEFEKNIYRKIKSNGHIIGNHTYSHDYSKIYSSVEAFKKDFLLLENLLVETIGYKPEIFRFPGGSNNQVSCKYGDKDLMRRLSEEMTKEGYFYFDWNVDSLGASARFVDFGIIIDSVLSSARNKEEAVILMHDSPTKTTTVQALPEIIVELRKQGFRFEPLTKESFPCRFKIP